MDNLCQSYRLMVYMIQTKQFMGGITGWVEEFNGSMVDFAAHFSTLFEVDFQIIGRDIYAIISELHDECRMMSLALYTVV